MVVVLTSMDMDGNFFWFWSGGFMKDVEIVNLAATTASVTPKQFTLQEFQGLNY